MRKKNNNKQNILRKKFNFLHVQREEKKFTTMATKTMATVTKMTRQINVAQMSTTIMKTFLLLHVVYMVEYSVCVCVCCSAAKLQRPEKRKGTTHR